jgi:pimeloyl-ACP methyl ester carboxylesterase
MPLRSKEPADYRRGPLRSVWPSPARVARRRVAKRADEEYGATAEPDWRQVDWLSHQHDVEIDGASVHYADLGQGEAPPVVFVHGLGGCWQNWLENLPAVSLERRVIALDLPGFGLSEMPREEEISITLFARTVERLCQMLDLGHVAVVGNSMGGFTAAELAIRSPERVERLVLVDAAGISLADAKRAGLMLGNLVAKGGGGRPDQIRRALRRPGYTQAAFGAVMRHPTRIKRELLAEQIHGIGKPGFAPSMRALVSYDFRDRLSEISCPALVVQGDQDILVPLGDAREYERRIPKATSLILADTGHVPMIERPLTFNRALFEFLGQEVAPDQPSEREEPVLSEGAERPV